MGSLLFCMCFAETGRLHEKDGFGKIERKHRDSKGEQYGVITKKNFFLCVIFSVSYAFIN